ncbi:Coiled-coil domain-containing protein 74B [Trichoplax sp. H2]|nr:Coiled-coil domain-containing protein 74B [Trichoplax sp. H2]|eukprot:RDD41090.1 Coiled-coil domain-containing protein 74B [Trichoplax sp. H2]
MSRSYNLPPLVNAPSWSRSRLERHKIPRSVNRDNITPSSTIVDPVIQMDGKLLPVPDGANPEQRIRHLDKSIEFLKEQHADILKGLHKEIEGLQSENKELQLKVIINQRLSTKPGSISDNNSSQGSRNGSSVSMSSTHGSKINEMKIASLTAEIKGLHEELSESQKMNSNLFKLLEDKEKLLAMSLNDTKKDELIDEKQLDIIGLATAEELPSSLSECQAVIKYLKLKSFQDQTELQRLKNNLREALYSDKWTPDAFLMAKAYIHENDSSREVITNSNLPLIHERKPQGFLYVDPSSVPPMKPKAASRAVIQYKRTQAAQKARLRKESAIDYDDR